MLLNSLNDYMYHYSVILFVADIILLVILTTIILIFKNKQKRWSELNDYLGNVTKTVDSVRYGNLTRKLDTIDIPYSENLSDSINRMIETLHDRENMLVESQNELYKQNKFLEAIINSLSDGLIIINEDKQILRATKVVANWFYEDGKDIIGEPLSKFIEIKSQKSVSLWDKEDVIVLQDKASNFSASTVELKLEDKKKRYIVILKNITNQKELETLKEDFVATLTHDLKIPIIAETNMIELFLDETFGVISEKQKVALNNMKSSNKELLELVQTVLDTYKFRDGKINLLKEDILLVGFIEEIMEEMLPIANKTGNKLCFVNQRDIRVFADKFQLKRVIKNLIQNAISYGKAQTPIEIKIGEIPKYVIITVKDTGAGISKEDIDKIFNRYYSAARKFKKIGTGLGLYLSQQIAKAHNGDLSVESVQGEYTEFCIKIPV